MKESAMEAWLKYHYPEFTAAGRRALLSQMREAGTAFDPEEPELPQRLRVIQERALADSMRFGLAIDKCGHEGNNMASAEEIYQAAAHAYNREREGESLHAVISDFLPWALATFPKSTPQSCFAHLQKEVAELAENVTNEGEIADCVFLLLDLCQRAGIDVVAALRRKLEIAKSRKWGEPDEQGVVEHIRDEPAAPLPKRVRITRKPSRWPHHQDANAQGWVGREVGVYGIAGWVPVPSYAVRSPDLRGPWWSLPIADCEPVEEPDAQTRRSTKSASYPPSLPPQSSSGRRSCR